MFRRYWILPAIGQSDYGDQAISGRHDDSRLSRNFPMRITKKESHEPGDRHERKSQQPIAEDNWYGTQQDRRDDEWNSIANHGQD